MAAGTAVVYMVGFADVMTGDFDGDSATLVAHLCSAGYTPSAPSHSSWTADISAYELQTSGYASKTVTSVVIDRSDASHIRFDCDDITFSSTALMDAKYVVIRRQSNARPFVYCDLETGATSGVAATQVIVSWPSTGVFRISQTGI